MQLTKDEMLEIRRKYAESLPKSDAKRFSMGEPRNGKYATGKDKDGLTRAQRDEIEAIKDAKNYPVESDLF